MAITWLADELRRAGLTVVEHAGWKTRAVAGAWSPQFGIVHATAAPRTQPDETQVRIVRDGRADLDGPIAVACVDRQGRWQVLGSGRCNTTLAGTAGPWSGKGNSYALGVEACNDNLSEPWPDVQYRAYVRGWAAICRKLGWTADRLRGHKEHTPDRKTDPTFDMAGFRANVARVLAGEDDDMSEQAETQIAWLDGRVEALGVGADKIAAGRPGAGQDVWAVKQLKALAAAGAEQRLRDEAILAAVRDDEDQAAILARVDQRAAELAAGQQALRTELAQELAPALAAAMREELADLPADLLDAAAERALRKVLGSLDGASAQA